MENELKWNFQVGKQIYVVDYWGTKYGTQAIDAKAKIFEVDVTNKTITAVLYGDTYQVYSFKDYGRLIFDTKKEAIKAANNMPKPKSILYQIIGKRIYKKTVEGIYSHYTDGVYDLVIRFYKGKDISSKEIDHSLFISEIDARNAKK